jgi:hypothetical protein
VPRDLLEEIEKVPLGKSYARVIAEDAWKKHFRDLADRFYQCVLFDAVARAEQQTAFTVEVVVAALATAAEFSPRGAEVDSEAIRRAAASALSAAGGIGHGFDDFVRLLEGMLVASATAVGITPSPLHQEHFVPIVYESVAAHLCPSLDLGLQDSVQSYDRISRALAAFVGSVAPWVGEFLVERQYEVLIPLTMGLDRDDPVDTSPAGFVLRESTAVDWAGRVMPRSGLVAHFEALQATRRVRRNAEGPRDAQGSAARGLLHGGVRRGCAPWP